MQKIKHQRLRKNSSQAASAKPFLTNLRWQYLWSLLLLVFFLVSPLFVVSSYTPDGQLFCTIYDLPKIYFIAAYIPIFGCLYCYYLYKNTSAMAVFSNFLRSNEGVKLFILLLLSMALSLVSALVVKAGIYHLTDYILLGILGLILGQLFQQNQLRWVAIYALMLALLIFTSLGLLQFCGYKIPFLLPILGPASTLGYRNPAAHFIALVLPFVYFAASRHGRIWHRSKRPLQLAFFIAFILLSAAALALLFMNYSRAAIMALLAEVLVVPLFWFLSRKKAVGTTVKQSWGWLRLMVVSSLLLAVIISLIMLFPNSRNRVKSSINKFKQGGVSRLLEERYYHWGNSLMMIKDHPLLGVGLGNWRFSYPLYYKSFARDPLFNYQMQVRKAHNDYLQLAAECGIPALFFFLLLWGRQFYLLRYATTADDDGEDWRLPILASLTAFSVIMFFSFPMQMAYSRMFCFFLLALGEARAWPALSK